MAVETSAVRWSTVRWSVSGDERSGDGGRATIEEEGSRETGESKHVKYLQRDMSRDGSRSWEERYVTSLESREVDWREEGTGGMVSTTSVLPVVTGM